MKRRDPRVTLHLEDLVRQLYNSERNRNLEEDTGGHQATLLQQLHRCSLLVSAKIRHWRDKAEQGHGFKLVHCYTAETGTKIAGI